MLGKMALTGLSRGDRQAFSLECLCFSAIWGEPGNTGERRDVSLFPHDRLALASLATARNSLRLYGRTEGTFIRAPPAASSLPKGSVGAS